MEADFSNQISLINQKTTKTLKYNFYIQHKIFGTVKTIKTEIISIEFSDVIIKVIYGHSVVYI